MTEFADQWNLEDVELSSIPTDLLAAELDSYMPRGSAFGGDEKLCALWEELRSRPWSGVLGVGTISE